jgi:hypothetical protein
MVFGLRVVESRHLPEGVDAVIALELPSLVADSVKFKFVGGELIAEADVKAPREVLVIRVRKEEIDEPSGDRDAHGPLDGGGQGARKR